MLMVGVLKEVNPSLADAASVEQTVAVGCSLVGSALGWYFLPETLSDDC
jgi:arginase